MNRFVIRLLRVRNMILANQQKEKLMNLNEQFELGGSSEAVQTDVLGQPTTKATKRPSILGRLFLAIFCVGGFATALTVAGPAPAVSAANYGRVTCYNGASVVGVWVNVSGGMSGWASRSGTGNTQQWSYNTQNKSYSITVGCGGTTSKWAGQASTPYYSKTWQNLACFPGWGYGFGSIYVNNRCYAG